MAMIPAADARKKTNQVRGVIEEKEAAKQIIRIELAIRKAANQGDAYIMVSDLYGDTQAILEDYGYTIEWDDDNDVFNISW